MNKQLIKHIVKTELKWKKKHIKISFSMSAIALGILIAGVAKQEFSVLLGLFGFAIPLLVSLTSPLIAPQGQQANAPNQCDAFSWKYFHTVIQDRESFLVGFCLAGIASILPLLTTGIGFIIFVKIPIAYFVMALVPLFLIISFFRLVLIRNTIHIPRRRYFRYNKNESFSSWINNFILTLDQLIHFGSLSAAVCLIVTFAGGFRDEYGVLALVACLLILLRMLYHHTLTIWADERKSHWSLMRGGKRTLLYICICSVFATLSINIHGYLYQDTEEIFNIIEDGSIDSLREIPISSYCQIWCLAS